MDLQLSSGHDPAGDSTQAQWSQVWTNFGSRVGADLDDVFLFNYDGKVRISTIFPEGRVAKQYMMRKGETEGVYYLDPFDESDMIQLINLNYFDALKTPEGLILESVTTPSPNTKKKKKRVPVKRKRSSTDWRQETRPQIAARIKELLQTEQLNSDLESEFSSLISYIMGKFSMPRDRAKILDLIARGKGELTSAKNELIHVVAQERVKREKTNSRKSKKRMKEQQTALSPSGGQEKQEAIEVTLDNNICSSLYLGTLVKVVECQQDWKKTLQSCISAMEALETGHYFNNDKWKQVLNTIFGSDRSPRCQDVCVSVCVCDFLQKRTLAAF